MGRKELLNKHHGEVVLSFPLTLVATVFSNDNSQNQRQFPEPILHLIP